MTQQQTPSKIFSKLQRRSISNF